MNGDIRNCIAALADDEDLVAKWQDIQNRLNVYEIGEDGQIKEWYHENKLGDFGQFHHRLRMMIPQTQQYLHLCFCNIPFFRHNNPPVRLIR